MDITPPRIGLVIAFLTIVAVSARADDAPAPQVEAPKAIQWLSDPQMAVKQARAAQLPVVIYVSSKDCGYCRMMEKQSWKDQQVVKSVDSDYVALHLSPEVHGDSAAANVSAFPTTIVLDQNLKFHNGAAGFLDAKHLLALLKHRPARVAANAEAAAQ